jgi:hypothetical protein
MAPGFLALEPVMGDLGVAIGDMVEALVPVMPDLVDAFVAVAGVLPEVVRLLSGFVPLISPLANLVENLASLDGVVAGLLVTLLGYRALSTVATSVMAMATALTALRTAQLLPTGPDGRRGGGGGLPPIVPLGGGKGGKLGRLAKLGRFGPLAAIPGITMLSQGPGSDMGDAVSFIGGGAMTGAAAGPWGAALGAGAAGGYSIYSDVTRYRDRKAMYANQPTPVSTGGGTVVNVGGVTVNNPRSDIDVSRAIAAGIEEQRRQVMRRQDPNQYGVYQGMP